MNGGHTRGFQAASNLSFSFGFCPTTSFSLMLSRERDTIPITSFVFFDALLTFLLFNEPNTFGRNSIICTLIPLKGEELRTWEKRRWRVEYSLSLASQRMMEVECDQQGEGQSEEPSGEWATLRRQRGVSTRTFTFIRKWRGFTGMLGRYDRFRYLQ
jgi:hypothetical protein